jgi:AcrR family transcriptional regulator
MPRLPMKDSEIEEIKRKILDIAFEIVSKEGFSNLSMRKVASKLKMTAANIYNYYSNKDELNIEMRRYGHIILYDNILQALKKAKDIEEKASLFIYEFVSFGIKYPNYYDLMFTMSAPKYSDYIGTPMEELATREYTSSMRVFELAQKTTREYVESGGVALIDVNKTIIVLLSFLHGVITLYNSRLLKNIDVKPEETMEEIVSLLLGIIRDLKHNKPVKKFLEKLDNLPPGIDYRLIFKNN